jgi:hypothetical protein
MQFFAYFTSFSTIIMVFVSPLKFHGVRDLPNALNFDFHSISILKPYWRSLECSHTTWYEVSAQQYFPRLETYLGVPVNISVPAPKVIPRDRCRMISSTLKIKSSVDPSCLTSPLTLVTILSWVGSLIALVDAMTGPMGANLSNALA